MLLTERRIADPAIGRRRVAWIVLCALIGNQAVTVAAPPPADPGEFFESQVRPLLVDTCFKCHSDKKAESSLRVDSRAALMQGGDNGPAINPGNPKQSLLIQVVSHQADIEMPPDGELTGDQVAVLEKWIEAGAPWPGEVATAPRARSGEPTDEERKFWSFQPIADPLVPTASQISNLKFEIGHPIDAFIAVKLAAKGISQVAPADKHPLLRRATFDLTGMPPTPGEIEAFVDDSSPDALAKVVDRLLASPAYGERWGRHWLDVVRYADTAGETADYPVREAWKYRNYVIKSFNDDKPYDEFIREQIAGDLLAAEGPPEKFAERVTATGFLAISRRFGFDSINYQHLTIADTIDTVGQAVLGLSLGCARCHDHKYDPVTAADYYALYGIFASTKYAFPGDEQTKRPRDFVALLPAGQLEPLTKDFDARLAAIDAEAKSADEEKKPLAEQLSREPDNAELKKKVADLDARIAEIKNRRNEAASNPPYEVAYAVTEGDPQNAMIQKRGEPTKLGDEVPRRFLSILGGDALPVEEKGSGRRQLAQWLTRPENPLTARVIVNRVWQHHFGEGLVGSENNFGVRGKPPTHPELLDYLSKRLMENGWSLKWLHRFILQSRVYQQSSKFDAACAAVDPANELLWRFNRRRLDAEELRDSLLALGGQLDRSPGEAHPFPPVASWGYSQHGPFAAVYETNHRSVYLMTQRLKRHPFLTLFDGADTNASTAERTPTTVPTQALFIMNDPLVHVQSSGFARQLIATSSDAIDRVRLAYRMALGREANNDELRQAIEFIGRARERHEQLGLPTDAREPYVWSAFARTLFSSNEFVFID